VLAEDAFDGDGLGPVLVEEGAEAVVEGEEAVGKARFGIGADHVDGDHGAGRPGASFDDADAAAGQARVDPHDAHALLLSLGCRVSLSGRSDVRVQAPPRAVFEATWSDTRWSGIGLVALPINHLPVGRSRDFVVVGR